MDWPLLITGSIQSEARASATGPKNRKPPSSCIAGSFVSATASIRHSKANAHHRGREKSGSGISGINRRAARARWTRASGFAHSPSSGPLRVHSAPQTTSACGAGAHRSTRRSGPQTEPDDRTRTARLRRSSRAGRSTPTPHFSQSTRALRHGRSYLRTVGSTWPPGFRLGLVQRPQDFG